MVHLGALKNISSAKKYTQGAVIATGSMRAQMHIILKGEVGVFVNDRTKKEKRVAVFGPGEFFGEAAFFLEKDTRVTFVALTDVIVLPIYKHFITTFIKDEPEFCFELMKAMCSRLYDISAAYEEQTGHPWAAPESVPEEAPAIQPASTPEADPAASAPPPDADAQAVSQSPGFSLFPEGHGSYTLPLLPADKSFLMEKSFVCPICKKSIKALTIRPSKLITDKTDSDMRVRYKGVEPIYYDIVTCPHCLYSALSEMFECPDKPSPDLRRELEAMKPEIGASPSTSINTFSLFAGYYLALFCTPKCFVSPHIAIAKLLLKLNWIYQDCGDKQMEEKTAKQALDAYMYVYQNLNNPPKVDQQLCFIIGELYLKLNDKNNARNFLFKAQSNREGIPLLRTKAADRIVEIREMGGNNNG